MAFTVRELRDLFDLLEQHPEWRAELRRHALTDDLLALPQIMRDLADEVRRLAEAQRRTEERLEALAEAQRRTDQQLATLTARVEALVEAQRRTEERLEVLAEAQRRTDQQLATLTARVEALVEAQRRTEERLEVLAEAQRRTEERLEVLAEAQRRTEERLEVLAEAQRQTQTELEKLAKAQEATQVELRAMAEAIQTLAVDVGKLKEFHTEHLYRERAAAYFGRLLRGTRRVADDVLVRALDQAVDEGRLTREERDDLLLADVVVRGRPWERPDYELYLVVEVSYGVGLDDVDRAVRRAQRLSRVLTPAFPAVAGAWVTPDAQRMAEAMKVVQFRDGAVVAPEGWWSAPT